MNLLSFKISESVVYSIGMALLNSLWQASIIAVLLSITLFALRNYSARMKYVLSLGSLGITTAIAIRTFLDTLSDKGIIINNLTGEKQIIARPEAAIDNISNQFSYVGFNYPNLISSLQNFVFSNLDLIVAFWFAGLLILTIKFMGGIVYSINLKSRGVESAGVKVNSILNNLQNNLGIGKPVKIFKSERINVPSIIGFFKPVILIPAELITGLTEIQIKMIILHELMHLKRADYIVNIIQTVIEIIFFFNPAVKWISNKVREERENICDDFVLEKSNIKIEYFKALFNSLTPKEMSNLQVQNLYSNKNQLLRRINRMNGGKQKYSVSITSALIFSLMLMLSTFAACSSSGDWETSDPDSNETKVTFYGNDHGTTKEFKAVVNEGQIISLEIDGDRIPESEFPEYRKIVMGKIKNMDCDNETISFNTALLHKEMRELKNKLKDKKFAIKLDKEKFKSGMKAFKESMKQMKDAKFFSDGELSAACAELANIQIPNINIKINNEDFDFDFDSEEWGESMREFGESMKNFKVDIDLSSLDESMEELEENLRDLDIDLSELKIEMEKLENFITDLKDELVSDGYIENVEQDFNLEFNKDSLEVDGKRVSDADFEKYKIMYKEHFGKDLDDSFLINCDRD